MQSAPFRFISAAVTTLLLVALAAVIGLAIRDNSAVALLVNTPTAEPSQLSSVNAANAPLGQQDNITQTASLTRATQSVLTGVMSPQNITSNIDANVGTSIAAGADADSATDDGGQADIRVTGVTTPPGPSILALVALGPVKRVAPGGFSFQSPPGYAVEVTGSAVNMQAADADPAIGPVFLLSGGPPGQFVSGSTGSLEAIFAQFVDFFAGRDNFQVEKQRPLATANLRGLVADIANAEDAEEQPFAGQIFMARPGANQIFVMVGIAPTDRWESGVAADYTAVLNSINTFVPGLEDSAIAAETATAVVTTPDFVTLDTLTPDAETPDAPSAISAQFSSATGSTPVRSPTVAATPKAPTATSGATATPVLVATPQWQVLSNGNYLNAIVVENRTVWAASNGGAIAWNLQSGAATKFTTADGLAGNALAAAQSCPIASLGLVFGGEAGLQIFDLRSGGWRTLNSANSPMSFDNVAALYCDAEAGFLVVAYTGQGLDIFDANAAAWTYIALADSPQVYGVTALNDLAEIWLGTDAGVITVANGQGTLYNSQNSPLLDGSVLAVATDSTDAVWLIVENALFRVTGANGQRQWTRFDAASVADQTFPDGPLTGMTVAGDGTVWVASADVQICQFDPETERCIRDASHNPRQQNGLVAGPLTSMTIKAGESGEEVYYTTAGSGFSRFAEDRWRAFVLENELLQGNQIRHIVQEQNGAVWVASNGGVQQIDPALLLSGTASEPAAEASPIQRFEQINSGLFSSDIQVLQPDGKGGIWFGAEGAGYYDGATWSNYSTANGLVGGRIEAITIDKAQRVWFGAEEGLSIFNGDAFFSLTEAEGLPSSQITALLTDRIAPGNIVWIGTADGGLLRFDKNQIQVYNRNNANLPSNSITALAQDADGTLLVGTDRGVARFAEERATTIRPLGTTKITTIAVGLNSAVWVGTADSGVFHFNGLAWEQFASRNHLPAQHVTSILIDQDGVVWIGCANGGLVRYIDE